MSTKRNEDLLSPFWPSISRIAEYIQQNEPVRPTPALKKTSKNECNRFY